MSFGDIAYSVLAQREYYCVSPTLELDDLGSYLVGQHSRTHRFPELGLSSPMSTILRETVLYSTTQKTSAVRDNYF